MWHAVTLLPFLSHDACLECQVPVQAPQEGELVYFLISLSADVEDVGVIVQISGPNSNFGTGMLRMYEGAVNVHVQAMVGRHLPLVEVIQGNA